MKFRVLFMNVYACYLRELNPLENMVKHNILYFHHIMMSYEGNGLNWVAQLRR